MEEKSDHGNNYQVSDSRQYTEYLVEFMTQSSKHVVGMVDMINSSKISAQIGPIKSAIYYQVFLNSMSKIISRNSGTVIKNIGDCLLFYFDFKDQNEMAFTKCIECGLEMIRSQEDISQKLADIGLPRVDFRISADYGLVLKMKTGVNDSIDLIGPPVNMCSKINRLAGANQFVVGGDLFHMVKEFKIYKFKETDSFSLGFKQSYPVYSLMVK
jgi:class 3 adenylate cyclase